MIFRSKKPVKKMSEKMEVDGHIRAIYNLLKIAGVEERFIQQRMKDFLSQGLDEDEDSLIDFMVNEISSSFKTMDESFDVSCPGVYLFIGDEYSNQENLIRKIIYQNGGGEIISNREGNGDFAEKVSGINKVTETSLGEITSIARNYVTNGKKVYIDLCTKDIEAEDLGNLITCLRTGFEHCNVFLTLNSTSSEKINQSLVKRYREFIDGVSYTRTDHCLDWGGIFNNIYHEGVPVLYFSSDENLSQGLERANTNTLLNKILG